MEEVKAGGGADEEELEEGKKEGEGGKSRRWRK